MAVSSADRTMEYENPLCFELQKRFQNRGINAPGLASNVQSSEVVGRISRGLDPYETERKPQTKTASASAQSRVRPLTAQESRPVAREDTLAYTVRPEAYAKSHTYEAKQNRGFAMPEGMVAPEYAEAYQRAAKIRRTAAQFDRDCKRYSAKRRKSGIYAVPVLGGAFEVMKDWFADVREVLKRQTRKLVGSSGRSTEQRASRRRQLPAGAITLAIVFAVLVLVIIYSFAQVSEVKNEMTALESQQTALIEQQGELSLKLEKRDDIRVIQDIAMNQLGMVSADRVESRYITLSSGEKISVEENQESVGNGTLLSALQRILGNGN